MRVLSFTLSAFMGFKRGGTGVRIMGGAQANLILMLIFVYFIIIFLLLAGRGSRPCVRGGFDVATGKFVY